MEQINEIMENHFKLVVSSCSTLTIFCLVLEIGRQSKTQ